LFEDEEEQEEPEKAIAIECSPRPAKRQKPKVAKPKAKVKPKAVVQKKPPVVRKRRLPMRKSVQRRPIYYENVNGDYILGDKLSHELISQIVAHEQDLLVRRHQGDDPETHRIWDTSTAVLGRGLIVARSQLSNAGFGLYATRAFEANVLVTEYTGPELDKESAKSLRANNKDQYIRSLRNGFCINGNPHPALGEGCAQMANDGYPDHFPNNCEFVVVNNRDSVQEKPRVYLKTLRAIEAGEELLASYGKTYWKYHLVDDEDQEQKPPLNLADILCQVCQLGNYDDHIVLCDECNHGYHMYCLKPKMTEVPKEDWFCPRCQEEMASSSGDDLFS